MDCLSRGSKPEAESISRVSRQPIRIGRNTHETVVDCQEFVLFWQCKLPTISLCWDGNGVIFVYLWIDFKLNLAAILWILCRPPEPRDLTKWFIQIKWNRLSNRKLKVSNWSRGYQRATGSRWLLGLCWDGLNRKENRNTSYSEGFVKKTNWMHQTTFLFCLSSMHNSMRSCGLKRICFNS